jgi:DNA-binding CsgD family transcriptional regulator
VSAAHLDAGQAVGRERELASVARFVAGTGSQRALLLSGGPGIGKTVLWEAGVGEGRVAGMRVLEARPSEAEAQLSFAALSDLLDGVGSDELADVPTPQRRALEVALLRSEPGAVPPESRAIGLGFLNALRSLAEKGPVLVAVDDVHWLDPASAATVSFAARRLRDEAVRFLLAARPGPDAGLFEALEASGIERVDVSPLSLGAIRRLLYDRLDLTLSRQALRRIYETAEGNPFFALQLGRLVHERGAPEPGEELALPDGIDEVVGSRVSALPQEVRKALLAVSLSGELRASQLELLVDASTLGEAADSGVLVAGGERIRPSHPLLAAAARGQAHPDERRALHRELADVVSDETLRARHLALATAVPDSELAATVAAAAAGARARGATEDAVDLAEHALRLSPGGTEERAGLILALAGYLLAAGEPERVAGTLDPLFDALPAGPLRARAHLLLADARAKNVDEYERQLDDALADAGPDPETRSTALAVMSGLIAVARTERIAHAEALASEALQLSHGVNPETEHEALHALGWTRVLGGHSISDLEERAPALAESPFVLYLSVVRAACARHIWRGEVDEARATLTVLRSLAEERGEIWSSIRWLLHDCEAELRAGALDAAARLLGEWGESPDRDLIITPAYERCHALLAAERGDPGETGRWVDAAVRRHETSGVRWDLLEALRARGMVALLSDDPRRARGDMRYVWEWAQEQGIDDPGAFPVAGDLVEALVALGEHDDAEAVTGRLDRLAGEQEHPWGLATAKRCRGVLGLARGEDAGDLVVAAADAYGELGLRFDRARALLALGRAERRRKQWRAARTALEAAAGAFDEIGAAGWAARAREDVARVGARRPTAEGRLTPAERRVAELAAQGRSNKEIAAALFVGVHTVEVHLSHAYAKLGVRSRSQLAGRLEPT